MQCLDAGAAGLVLVIDGSGRLIATLTDGDIRRAILRGESLDVPVRKVAHARPVTGRNGAGRDEILRIFRASGVRQLPLVDDIGRPTALCLAADLATRVQRYTVVVMAGGRGSRLGALTNDTPKPLVRISGRPILEILVGQLAAEGFVDLIVTVNYLSDRLREHFDDGSEFGVKIDYVEEPEPLGTAGALSLLRDRLKSTFLVVNADLLTGGDFTGLIDEHERSHNDMTLATYEVETALRFGVVESDEGRVVNLTEKPRLRFRVNAGLYVMEPSALVHVPPQRADMPEVVMAAIAAGKRVGVAEIHDVWLDIGEESDLLRASDVYSERAASEA